MPEPETESVAPAQTPKRRGRPRLTDTKRKENKEKRRRRLQVDISERGHANIAEAGKLTWSKGGDVVEKAVEFHLKAIKADRAGWQVLLKKDGEEVIWLVP